MNDTTNNMTIDALRFCIGQLFVTNYKFLSQRASNQNIDANCVVTLLDVDELYKFQEEFMKVGIPVASCSADLRNLYDYDKCSALLLFSDGVVRWTKVFVYKCSSEMNLKLVEI